MAIIIPQILKIRVPCFKTLNTDSHGLDGFVLTIKCLIRAIRNIRLIRVQSFYPVHPSNPENPRSILRLGQTLLGV
jgi:hypothetical protein